MGMKHHKQILTRGLPKTGAVTARETGDDGDLQVGWWLGRTYGNNKPRFIPQVIGGVDVVIDRATGLMWPKATDGDGAIGRTPATWPNALIACNAHDWAGFTDWRLPNILELISIVWYEAGEGTYYPEFVNDSISVNIWTSTVGIYITTSVYSLQEQVGTMELTARSSILSFRPVRTFVGV